MTIDEAGSEQPAAAIDCVTLWRFGSNMRDHTVFNRHRALLNEAVAVDHGGDGKIGKEHDFPTCIRLYIQYSGKHDPTQVPFRFGPDFFRLAE